MTPEIDNNVLTSELLKAIRQLEITGAATNAALAALAALQDTLKPSPNPSRSIDKRLPYELWEYILTFLYPSQVARLSRVSKSLYAMISASVVWSRWFRTTFGPNVVLDTLPAIPESKSYMLYMCAVSSRICEQCLSYSVPCRLSNDRVGRAERPLPVLIPDAILGHRGHREPNTTKSDFLTVSPEHDSSANCLNPTQRSHSNILIQRRDEHDRKRGVGYVGRPINRTWKVLFCLTCRKDHYLDYQEEVPAHTLGKFMTFRRIAEVYDLAGYQIGLLPMRIEEGDVHVYSEEVAYRVYQRNHGGNVGLDPPFSIEDQERRTSERIDTYCQL